MEALVTGVYCFPFSESGRKLGGGIDTYAENLMLNTRRIHFTTFVAEGHSKGNVSVIKTGYINGKYFKNPSFNLLCFIKALRLDFDVIIAHDVVATLLGVILSRIKGKPCIAHFHGLSSNQPKYPTVVKKMIKLLEHVFRYPHIVVCHHEKAKNQLVSIGVPKHKIAVIKPGVTIKKMKVAREKKTVLFVGRLVKTKRVDLLLKAMKHLPKDYSLHIVGDGEERENLEELGKALGVNVTFHGARSPDVFYSKATVFVSPSETEGLGYTSLEAMCAGCPVIGRDFGYFPHDTGIFLKSADPKEIARAILKVTNDDNLARELTKNAEKYAEGFSWEKAGKDYGRLLMLELEKQD